MTEAEKNREKNILLAKKKYSTSSPLKGRTFQETLQNYFKFIFLPLMLIVPESA